MQPRLVAVVEGIDDAQGHEAEDAGGGDNGSSGAGAGVGVGFGFGSQAQVRQAVMVRWREGPFNFDSVVCHFQKRAWCLF